MLGSVGAMDAGQAVRDLMDLSSQIEAAAVIGSDGAVVAASPDDDSASAALARVAQELVGAAAELGSGRDVTRVEIELEDGALFVVREGDLTMAARTGPEPTSGLVVYDLRTSLRSIDAPPPKRKRATRAKSAEKTGEPGEGAS
jgi:predicted regulator of Ras-like GTPase activity (Roadblock/LC7/MglB family)